MQRELLISLTIGTIAALAFESSHGFSASASATESLGLEAANGQVLQVEGTVQIERHTGQTVSPTTGTLLYPDHRSEMLAVSSGYHGDVFLAFFHPSLGPES